MMAEPATPDPGSPDPHDQAGLTDAAVSRANARFYEALERADLDLMRAVWDHGDEVSCAHPGRRALHGWDQVWGSWEAILSSGGNPQVILTEETIHRSGPVAWVTAVENMISGEHTGAAAAMNVFAHDGADWRMVAHHAGPILG
jgi:ketosteroid isomerase-like protein